MQFVTVRKFRCLRKSTSASFIFSEKTACKKLVSIISKSMNIIKVFSHKGLKKSRSFRAFAQILKMLFRFKIDAGRIRSPSGLAGVEDLEQVVESNSC